MLVDKYVNKLFVTMENFLSMIQNIIHLMYFIRSCFNSLSNVILIKHRIDTEIQFSL